MKAWLTALFFMTSACSDRLNLGSNVLWFSEHETGDLSAWTEDDLGGVYASDESATYTVTTEAAHSGRYSVKLTATAVAADSGSGLYRQIPAATEAYYSVWYYLPKAYETLSAWTVLRFRSASPAVADSEVFSIDLNLRSLPDGRLVLWVVEQRQAYLAWPLAIPTPIVPVGQWFQLEVRFRSRSDETGLLKVWLDGRLVYDLEERVTGQGDSVYFNPCNQTNTMNPSAVELYVDDSTVSLSRITEAGTP